MPSEAVADHDDGIACCLGDRVQPPVKPLARPLRTVDVPGDPGEVGTIAEAIEPPPHHSHCPVPAKKSRDEEDGLSCPLRDSGAEVGEVAKQGTELEEVIWVGSCELPMHFSQLFNSTTSERRAKGLHEGVKKGCTNRGGLVMGPNRILPVWADAHSPRREDGKPGVEEVMLQISSFHGRSPVRHKRK